MSKPSKNTPLEQQDAGFELARRYCTLTVAMQHAARQEQIADFDALVRERDRVLDQLEALPELSPAAIRELTTGFGLGEDLQSQIRSQQEANVSELVTVFKGKQGHTAYRSHRRGDDHGAFRQAG